MDSRWTAFRMTGLALACLAACTDPGDTPQRIGLSDGDHGIYFDAETSVLSLERRDDVLMRIGPDGFQLGKVTAVDDDVNYDPWPLLAGGGLGDYTPPEGLRWLPASSVELAESSADRLSFRMDYPDGKTAGLAIVTNGAGSFLAVWTPDNELSEIAYFRLRPQVDTAEGFYGLGAYLDQVNHRGRLRPMQREIDLGLESGTNEAHVPVPFVTGTRGWGLFVENPCPAVFDVASESDDRLAAVFGTGPASGEGLRFHLFSAPHPLDVTRLYYEVTGYPLLPAAWALGPWIWRDENDDQAQVIGDIQTIRDLDLATTAIWIDRPYASAVNSFDFNPAQFDDPPAMIAAIRDLGFHLALWHTPYLDENDEATADLLAYAEEQGYFPPTTSILFNHWGRPIDLTNPDAYAWWQGLIRAYTDMGVEGFKLDYAEDVNPGMLGARNRWEFFDGSDERTMHGRYQLFYHRVYAETLPAAGGFLLCRSGTYGDQVNVSVIWPGDLDANMAFFGEEASDNGDTYVAVGGLPASLIYGLSLGPSGFPFYGSDTGGYRHSPPDKETFSRWFEQTSLSSVMQIGTSSNNVAWEFDPQTGFDEEMLGWYRTYVRLHLRLWPYLWTLARNLAKDGRPLMRPLGLAYPDLGVHPDAIYLLGPDLLVAPVVTRGARQKEVVFPPGRWIDWWSGEVLEGGTTRTVDAPLDRLPLFLREGGIVPLLRPTIDTLSATGQPGRVDSYATTPGILYPRVAPGAAGTFELFDHTVLGQERTAAGIRLSVEEGNEFRQGVLFEVVAYGTSPPASVADNGNDLPARANLADLETAADGWCLESGSLYLKVAGGGHTVVVTD